jgi:hypothetical protein
MFGFMIGIRKHIVAIVKGGGVFTVGVPPGWRIFPGPDFDILGVGMDGEREMWLGTHVLRMAAETKNGFRLIGFEPLPDK